MAPPRLASVTDHGLDFKGATWWRVAFDIAGVAKNYYRRGSGAVTGELTLRDHRKSTAAHWCSFPRKFYPNIVDLPTARREIVVWTRGQLLTFRGNHENV